MADSNSHTHTVMPKSLAKALMDAGMQHFAMGGPLNTRAGNMGWVQSQSIPQQQGAPNMGAPTSNTGSVGQPTRAGGGNPYGTTADQFEHGYVGQGVMSGSNPGEALNGVGAAFQGLGQAFTAQNTYNANLAPQMQSDYGGVIQQGAQNSLGAYNQQQNLANTLIAQSNGQGPNPAQNMLNQATANNIQNQGALMASQRGANANPALMARQASMQGANTQQQAAGQAATMNSQQQLAAQAAAANLYGNMGQQSNQLYGTSVAGQNTQNANNIQNMGMAQGINAQVAQSNVNSENRTTGGILGALGAGGASMFSEGGSVANYQTPDLQPGSAAGVTFQMPDKKKKDKNTGGDVEEGGAIADLSSTPQSGSQVGAYAGKGSQYLTMSEGGDVADGGATADLGADNSGGAWAEKKQGGGGGLASMLPMLAMLASKGGGVPGKANAKGNSVSNDVVPALLSPGEEVIDRETMQDPGPIGKAARLVAAHINSKKQGMEDKGSSGKAKEFLMHLKGKKKGFGSVVEARAQKKACGGKVY